MYVQLEMYIQIKQWKETNFHMFQNRSFAFPMKLNLQNLFFFKRNFAVTFIYACIIIYLTNTGTLNTIIGIVSALGTIGLFVTYRYARTTGMWNIIQISRNMIIYYNKCKRAKILIHFIIKVINMQSTIICIVVSCRWKNQTIKCEAFTIILCYFKGQSSTRFSKPFSIIQR